LIELIEVMEVTGVIVTVDMFEDSWRGGGK
jgi:hypothetical protein